MTAATEVSDGKDVEIRTYTKRWAMIGLYNFAMCFSMMQNNEFTIIIKEIQRYYDTSDSWIRFSNVVFMYSILVVTIPSIYITERFNLRCPIVIAAGLTFVGNGLKLLAVSPGRFYVVIIGQLCCAVGQVFLMALPSKIVAVWCKIEEINKACAVSILGGAIGQALAVSVPIWIVGDLTKESDIENGLWIMFSINAVLSGVAFFAVVIFFKGKPDKPPSTQQVKVCEMEKENKIEALKRLSKNVEFIKITVVFGLLLGMFQTFNVFNSQLYTDVFPDNESDLSTVTLTTILLGNLIVNQPIGYILDKTSNYKFVTLGISMWLTVAYGILITCLELKTHTGSFIALFIQGFSVSPLFLIAFQYLAEVSHPVSEMISSSLFFCVVNLVGIIFENILDHFANSGELIVIHLTIFSVYSIATVSVFFLSPKLNRSISENK